MATVSIVIPAYNEERGIAKTVADVKKAISKVNRHRFEIVVVNDCSTDKTETVLSKISGIKVLHNEQNRGYGGSLKRAIRQVNSEYVLIIDSDGTYPASEIVNLVKHIPTHDMVVGARIGDHVKIPTLRKPAKWFLKHFAQFLTKTEIPDLNSGLRVFRRDIALKYYNLFPDGFSFTTTITMICLTSGYSVKYLPINYYERKGTSTIRPIRDFVGFTNLIFRLTIFFRPLNVFLPLSMLVFLAGIARLVRDVMVVDHFGIGGLIVVFFSFQLALIGILADLIIKRTSL